MSFVDDRFDVAVIGAGPAGSAAAYHLARSGRRVLLIEQHSFPRDKACGDGLTSGSLKLLSEMELDDELRDYQRVHGIRIGTDTKGYQERRFNGHAPGWPGYGVVIPRSELDHLICKRAVAAGASLWENTLVTGPVLKNGRVCGVRVRRNGSETEVATTFVVAADGGNSYFARKVGLFEKDRWSRGFAVRGYFTDIVDVEELFQIYVPLLDPAGGRALGGYGWIFPLGSHHANIGVGFFPTQQQDFNLNLRMVFDHFISNLKQTDERLSGMRLVGSLRGGPLPCGMNPSKCVGKGVVLVGDAAGLVDPFTGEGINTALESGKFAADVLDAALSSSDPLQTDLAEYSRLLEENYRDRFQIGKQFVKTYGFMWRLLENTFDIERPLFTSMRRALIGFGSNNHNHLCIMPPRYRPLLEELSVLEDLEKVQDETARVIQSEFPLLSKVSSELVDSTARFLRSALVFLSGRFGESNHPARITAATSIELACLAHVMHDNVLDNSETKKSFTADEAEAGVNWGNMFAVMAGNYLLAKAYELTTELGHEISQTVSCASSEVCVGRIWETRWSQSPNQSEECYLKLIEKKTATLYELSCRLGARLSNAPDPFVAALSAYGRNLGMAYRLTNDILDIMAGGKETSEARYSDHPTVILEKAYCFVRQANECLNELPCGPAKTALADLSSFVIERVQIGNVEEIELPLQEII